MVDHAHAYDRRKRDARVALLSERRAARAVRRDGAERLEDVVVHDERKGHISRQCASDRRDEIGADLLEVERSGDRCRETEDRAELLLLLLAGGLGLLLGGLGTGERGGETMHDRRRNEADAQPDDE